MMFFPGASAVPVSMQGPALRPVIAVLVFALSVSLWSWWNNAERMYKHGHELLDAEEYVSASRAFDNAYSARHVPGKKGEALFWASRSLEFANEYEAALKRYHELARLYPDNYWAAESLYRIVLLEKQSHNESVAGKAYQQLLQDFPGNNWTRKAGKLSGMESGQDESERIYRRGHKRLKEKQYVSAFRAFDRAYKARQVPAQKAEALFWAGRSLEFASEHEGALERYQELVSLYPDNYWAAESLYRIMLLAGRAHDERNAENAYNRLLQDFPENSWTLKAIKASGAKP
ncbi:MAG TPA: tetratricopeptide repeat protein [Gammaproteobacteria bacterium]|nr:tetratricopeptide repeat protein [Gammaproteobacteria bacterium]